MTTELDFWIRSKPGPFSARTSETVWTKAWNNFRRDHPSNLDGELIFRNHMVEAGFNVRHLGIGGYSMDKF